MVVELQVVAAEYVNAPGVVDAAASCLHAVASWPNPVPLEPLNVGV
jgi:hypothetical protein